MSFPDPVIVDAATVVPEGEPFGRIYQTVRNVLDAYVVYFDAVGVDLPVNANGEVIAFVSDGSVAYDDPLLAIEVPALRPGRPGDLSSLPILAGTTYSIETKLHLVREVPVVDTDGAPTAEAIEEAAQALLLDWWTILQGALELTAKSMSGDPNSLQGAPYRRVMVQEIVAVGPGGGISTTGATLALEMI